MAEIASSTTTPISRDLDELRTLLRGHDVRRVVDSVSPQMAPLVMDAIQLVRFRPLVGSGRDSTYTHTAPRKPKHSRRFYVP